jgi:hypothetical protein
MHGCHKHFAQVFIFAIWYREYSVLPAGTEQLLNIILYNDQKRNIHADILYII